MNNKIFWLRLTYLFILVTLTLCYIFGDVIQSWRSWISGLAYGLAISGLMSTFDRQRPRR